ncbi:MAG: hypothetical protein M1827_004780 [Pycnora praestabilis]|nr:MAG: hypothetical protein M1827_004780 [Pycnora praestabilis]
MGDYKLSASLEGHSDDVRSVAFPHPDFVLSASRDATVRLWKLLSNTPPQYDDSISSHGTAFINALTYLQPTSEYPEGLIISGGKDTIIEVRQPAKKPEENADALLLGHSHNVCTLDVDPEGHYIVSGGWDGQARIWSVGKWVCESVLEGHEGSVWAVLAYTKDIIITACADMFIRVFGPSGKLVRTIRGNTDVVRALCRVPNYHPSGAQFASASNDGIIRLWTLEGRQVGELLGHDSFIYSLASLPSGELVSSGEDRTIRIWRSNQCVQTITHPAISVWGVAACGENGDIVSGASDRIVRVFSRDKERQAEPEVIQIFEDSVKSSSIPQQAVGDVNKEKLPGPEFLQKKSGTKEGQVVMIREEDGSVTAHQWSQGMQQWVNVGTVVDAVGSSGKKKEYLGKDYDYVFDVDIEDGKPPLKLPYNLSQNPYEAATKFIQENELPISYLDQVANFITTNIQGATIGQSSQSQPPGPDPWGTEHRYRPGDQPSSRPAPRPKVLPQKTYLSIKTANLKTIQKKIEELNQQLILDGSKDVSLNPSELFTLQALTEHLEQAPAAAAKASPALSNGLELVIKLVTTWPPPQRLPGLDLLRLMTVATPTTAEYRDSTGDSIVGILERSGVFEDKERTNNVMLAVRAFANLFETKEGRSLAEQDFDKIRTLIKSASSSPNNRTNRNLTIAITTLYINYAVVLTSAPTTSSTDSALTLLDDLTSIISTATDSEASYRALVAAGTLLTLDDGGEEVRMAAKEVFDLSGALRKVEAGVKEPRIKGVVGEIKALMD